MGKTTLDQIPLIDINEGKKQPFARKVVVIAYYLKKRKDNSVQPYFLLTVIVPKQPVRVTKKWYKAKSYKLPGGFSLIKGSREMIRSGKRVDIPPAFGGYFRKINSDNLKKKDQDKKVNGVLPAALTALREAKEEAGIKPRNIKLIFDLGVRKFRVGGKRRIKVDTFAIELKQPKNGKAIDSLAVDYFSIGEMKKASKLRTQFNIPLVRPSHVEFVEKIIPDLIEKYRLEGKIFSEKISSRKKIKKRNERRRLHFIQLVKNARQGKFLAYKLTIKKTRENIIEKSNNSRKRQKRLPQGKF